MRWRISSNDPPNADLRFELLDDSGGYQPIDFSQSVFQGGEAPCQDGIGSCFQYVLRGQYAGASVWDRPVRAVHATYGVLPGALPASSTVANTVTFVSFFHTGNDMVYVNITDAVASDGTYLFPRPFNQTMWPTKGLCVSDSPPDGVQFSPLDPTTSGFPPPSPLTDDGTYCIGLHPVPRDGGAAALVQNRVATLPEVASVDVGYTPPIEESPVIYQIVFDLSIVGSRCPSAIPTIEAAVKQAMSSANVPVVQLPTINLALDPSKTDGTATCTQQNARTLDADTMAEVVKETVAQFPEQYQQFHFFYFNNVNFPLPPTLTDSLQRLFDDLATSPPGHDLTTISWLFNPGLASSTGPTWSINQSWQTADDPGMKMALTDYAEQNLPYQSQIQDRSVPIPFFSDEQLTKYAGGALKICNSSSAHPPLPVDLNKVLPLGSGPSWTINGDDPPGFLIDLPTEVNQPASQFVQAGVSMHLQVCTRYCSDHPYVSTAGTGVTSWAPSALCASDQ